MRTRVTAALLISALLHGALILRVQVHRIPSEPARAIDGPLELEIVEAAPASPLLPPSGGESRRKQSSSGSPRPGSSASAASVAGRDTSSSTAASPAVSTSPSGRSDFVLPTTPSLTPSSDALTWTPEPSQGHTLHPGDVKGPDLVAEKARVGGRVTGFAEDQLASARAQRGLPHPFYGQMGEAMKDGLAKSDGGKPAQLGVKSLIEQYNKNAAAARESYARTGNPNLGPPGEAPTPSEKFRQLGKDGEPSAPMQMRMLAQAVETRDAIRSMAPLLSLELEMEQLPDGTLKAFKLRRRSINPAFDAFVLKVVPQSLASVGPVPEDALRQKPTLRSVWQVDGWLRADTRMTDKLNAFGVPLSALGELGIPIDEVDRLFGAEALRFDYKVRLLQAF